MADGRFDGPHPVAEHWISRKLGLPISWDAGVTSGEQRRDTVRDAIVKRGLNFVVAGVRDGHPETWAELFERVYGEPLVSDAAD